MSWADDDLYAGRVLGPYELLVPVGSGGMAQVWAARHRGAGANAIFALKMLKPHLAENASFRDMFFDEARIASRIRHENVARTFELVDLDGILTLVMEWVDGSSLVNMLRPGPDDHDTHPLVALPIRHAVKLLAETCAGLHAAHELLDDKGRSLGVVHRDVSPHNILLMLDGHVKVTDFGVAKAVGKSHMTIAGQVKGKLAYMSPEQLVGGGIDRRSDVFALGTVLYESTTGQRPFLGDHDPQVMTAIIMGTCKPPTAVMRGYPRELETIVMRALAVDPDARFSTALQLRQALEGWLSKSGPPVGSQQIALLLQERCGPEIAERANALGGQQQPQQQSQPQPHHTPGTPIIPTLPPKSAAGTPPPSGVVASHERIESGSSAMEVDRRSMAAPERTSISAVGGVVAVLVGLILGLCVLAYVRAERKSRAAAALADASVVATLGDGGVGTTASGAALTTTKPKDPPPPPPIRSVDVTLRMPEDARVVVDGVELPAGSTQVRRPDAGLVTVLIRADGREDAIYIIEPSSPNEIAVSMIDKPVEDSKPTHRKNPGQKGIPAVVPPNPYD